MYVTQYGYIDIVCLLQCIHTEVISHSVRIRAHVNYYIMILYDIC